MLKRFSTLDLNGQFTSALAEVTYAAPRLRLVSLDMDRPTEAEIAREIARIAAIKASGSGLATLAHRGKSAMSPSFRLNAWVAAGVVAAAGLDGAVFAFAKPVLAAIAAASLFEKAALSAMIAGLGVRGFSALRQYLGEKLA